MSGDPQNRRTRRRRRRSGNAAQRVQLPDLTGTYGPDRRRLRAAARRGHPEIAQQIEASRSIVRYRIEHPIPVRYPDTLPFASSVGELKEAIDRAQVVVVCGETGSGKSTQLPKLCLEMGRGTSGLIGHTQPRRLAARSVASRIATELGVQLGREVGSKVRFGDDTSSDTRIKVMTDGILLAESRSDRRLEQYDTLIVDEAHERSLNIDFLLGILTKILHSRSDLKLIITSATIDTQRFADHFEQALHTAVPVIEVSGRTFPVEVEYRPPIDEEGRSLDLPDAIAEAAERLAVLDGFGPSGDVLVFLPGEREIREAAVALRKKSETSRLLAGVDIVPLYARLSFDEQQRAFRTSSRRRIVLATNVAETSLTVPGIRYVIDSGLARVSRYSPRRRVQSLQIEPVSQASARQRAGRCGRTEPGVCIRLYSEEDLAKRDVFTPPEIQRTSLAGVILQMRALGLGDPRSFPFIEPPDQRRIAEAYETLRELGATTPDESLTPLGEQLARLPVDPRIGRILLSGHEHRVLADALIIAASIETQDPRERPADSRASADAKHERFSDPTSDYLSLLKLWDYYHEQKDRLSRSQLRKTMKQEYLSFVRMNEWTDTHRQLRDICRELGLHPGKRTGDAAKLHASILAGFVTSVGKRHPEGGYVSPVAGRFHIHPGSAVREKGVSWLVVTELVRTTRLYARSCAVIGADAVEAAAAHLLTREYDQPEYNEERGIVEASMRVMLGSIEIARDRKVDYGSVDRCEARRIFIEEALVGGRFRSGAVYESKNEAFLYDLAEQEARLRTSRRPSDEAMFRFFDERIPGDISSARRFDRWRRKAERDRPDLFEFTAERLGLTDVEAWDEASTPEQLEVGRDAVAKLVYRFEPGDERDGIEAVLPVESAANADLGQLGWLVPGWVHAKVEAVLRGLPRSVRRQVELSELVSRVQDRLRYGQGEFFAEVARAATDVTGVTITPDMCRRVEIPEHLRVLFRVVDPAGQSVVISRDTDAVVAESRRVAAEQAKNAQQQQIHLSWPSQTPTVLPSNALTDAGAGVRLVEVATADSANALHWLGVRRLASIALLKDCKPLLEHTPGIDRIRLLYRTLPGAPDCTSDLVALIPEVNRFPEEIPPTSVDRFDAMLDHLRAELADRVLRLVRVVDDILSQRQKSLAMLERLSGSGGSVMVSDAVFQAEQLFHLGTLRSIRWPQLCRLGAYFRGIEARLDRARGPGRQRDELAVRQVMPHWRRCIERAQSDARIGRIDPMLDRYRWMIEEYRLTLFAPQLAVRGAASERKLDELWASITGTSPAR